MRPSPGPFATNSAANFAAKLEQPPVTPDQVARPALSSLICNASIAKLVLLRAPAGFGKTTVMNQARACLEQSGIETAWLTLDQQDNSPERLLRGLSMAAANLWPDRRGATTPLETIEMLASHPSPLVLFLDEFEVIHDPDVLKLLREIIDRLPRRSQIVVGSRSVPNLGLGRLRARGQLLEIDAEQLRFTLDETREFIKQHRLDSLPAEDVLRLHAKTEGWVTALWLASITLAQHGDEGKFIEHFSGSSQAVADFLAEDVLSRQAPEARQFLLRTSILKQLNPALCQSLCPAHNSAEMLEHLASTSLFLTPIPGEQHAYRYHHLFADYLRSQLALELPNEVARLHLAASGWCESHSRPGPAIDHAIDGGDHPYALSLLSQHAPDFLKQGRLRLLARWFSQVPEHLVAEHPLLLVTWAWAICFTRGPRDAWELLKRSGCLHSGDETVAFNVKVLSIFLLTMTDRFDEAFAACKEIVPSLPTGLPFTDSVLINCMSHLAATLGDQEESQRLTALTRSAYPDSAFNRMYSDCLEGVLDLQQGRLRHAMARFRMAVGPDQPGGATHSNVNAWAAVLLADTMYETNQFDQTEHLLNIHLPLARDLGLPERLISCHLILARIAFCRGDIDQAFQHLIQLEYIGQNRQLPRLIATARLERSRLLLLQGNSLGSRVELERANDQAVWTWVRKHRQVVHDLDYIELAQMRWEMTFGDAAAVARRLLDAFREARQRGLGRRALKLEVLRALATAKSGDLGTATTLMSKILLLACQEGYVRLILDEGTAAAQLIQRVYATVSGSDGPRSDPIFVDYLQRLLKICGPVEADEDASGPQIVEALSRKEVRVLQLVAEGYSNSAMAEKLFVSDSTIRTHLRNISAKLQAQNRTQAVAIARRLKLMP